MYVSDNDVDNIKHAKKLGQLISFKQWFIISKFSFLAI